MYVRNAENQLKITTEGTGTSLRLDMAFPIGSEYFPLAQLVIIEL